MRCRPSSRQLPVSDYAIGSSRPWLFSSHTYRCLTSSLRHRSCLHRQAGRLPLGKPVFQPTRFVAELAELGDRFEGQNAVGSSAVGYDLGLAVELGQLALELAQRNVASAWKMAEGKLVLGPHV